MRLTLRLRNQTRVAAVAKEDGRKLDGGLSVDFTSAAFTLDISINSLSNSLSLPALSLSFIFLFTFSTDTPIIVLLSLPGNQTRRMTRSPSSTQASLDDDDERDSRGRRKERPQQLDLIDFSDKTSLFVNDKASINSFYIPSQHSMPSWIIGDVYTRKAFELSGS